MYKLLNLFLTVVITSFTILQNGFSEEPQNDQVSMSRMDKLDALLTEVNAGTSVYELTPDLTDFKNKSFQGLTKKYPEINLKVLQCEKLTDWTPSVSDALESFFREIYKNDISNLKPEWVSGIVEDLMNNQSKIGIMNWQIESAGATTVVRSIAVFDNSWNVLFDTELMNFTDSEEIEVNNENDNNSPNSTTTIKSTDTQTRSRTLNLNGTFGSVQLRYQVKVTAEVSPYILESTNDAEYNYYTDFITCERINPSGIPPNGIPFVYFGTGGTFATLYQNAIPYKSPVTFLNNTGDRFNGGIYKINGANGNNWSFDFDFTVDFPGGGIGITPHSNISPLSLEGVNNSSINLLNTVYNHVAAIGDVRAVFFNNGNLFLDDFFVKAINTSYEIERINVNSKFQVGYMAPNISGILVPNFFNETTSAFNFPVSYIRGNKLLQPSYQLTSTRYNIAVGQIDTLKAKITNNSHYVPLTGGNISVDISSLQGHLTLLSPATISIATIDTSSSKEFKFTVIGNSNGVVTPQVNISTMGWGSPVPPEVRINNIISINSNIDVGPLTKTLSLTMLMEGFYNSGSDNMTPDTLRVYMRNSSSPYAVLDSAKSLINSGGTGTFLFTKLNNFIPYYIQLKHRNTIETWSNGTNIFTGSSMTYDFTGSALQAFGNNEIQVDTSPVRFATYSGDVNQDGTVDITDGSLIDNDASIFASGYLQTDMNGDGIVDVSDAVFADNNGFNFVGKITP